MTEHRDDPVNAKPLHSSPTSRKKLGGAEYEALRDEILKRIELQYQLLNLALIVVGTILTISLGGGVLTDAAGSSSQGFLLLLCAPLEMFLALGWAAHNVQIAKAGVYIKANYEEGWETYWPQNEGLSWPRKPVVQYLFTGGAPAMGVFVGTQILTLFLAYIALPETGATVLWCGWYIGDMVVTLLTAVFISTSNIRAQLLKTAKARMGDQADDSGTSTEEEKGKAHDESGGEAR
jgi:hypothetical protein